MSGELITGDGQAQIGNVLLGSSGTYRLQSLTGWDDLPGLDMADLPRPNADGAWPGTWYAQPRTITADVALFCPDPTTYPAAIAKLRAATAPYGAEQPLVIQLGGQQLLANVRCTGRLAGADGYALGIEKVALKFLATDPRRYSNALSSAVTSPPSAPVGITWPITWPVSWGTSTSGGTVFAANVGDWPTPPTITITGPLTAPAVYRQDTGAVLEFNTTLTASNVLVIDVLGGVATLDGAIANSLLTDRSAPISSFLLPPGSTGLALRASVTDPSATMTVAWRSAYL